MSSQYNMMSNHQEHHISIGQKGKRKGFTKTHRHELPPVKGEQIQKAKTLLDGEYR